MVKKQNYDRESFLGMMQLVFANIKKMLMANQDVFLIPKKRIPIYDSIWLYIYIYLLLRTINSPGGDIVFLVFEILTDSGK